MLSTGIIILLANIGEEARPIVPEFKSCSHAEMIYEVKKN